MADLELPRRSRPRRAGIPAAILAGLWLAMLTFGAGPADEFLLATGYAADKPLLAAIARGITVLGEGEVMILISVAGALLLLWRRRPGLGLALIAVTLVGRVLVSAQKYAIGRLRPEDNEHLVQVHSPAFPSAHAANSMIVFLTIALILTANTRWQRAAAGLAIGLSLLVGSSRVVLGVHWPSDVVGGWAFGLLWVLMALPLAERAMRPRVTR